MPRWPLIRHLRYLVWRWYLDRWWSYRAAYWLPHGDTERYLAAVWRGEM